MALTQIQNAMTQLLGNSSSALSIDSSGNMGIGVTPSAWSGFRAMQIGGTTSLWSSTSGYASSFYTNNGYFNGTNRVYLTSGYASEYIMGQGSHYWYTAPSGTAGNAISFTQAMTLDASGKLLVGTSTGSSGASVQASFVNSNGGGIQFGYPTTGGGALVGNTSGGIQFYGYAGAQGSEGFVERARIDSSGNLLVGITSKSSVIGTNSKFSMGLASIGNVTGGGTGAIDTGISINGGAAGGTILFLASRNTGAGTQTASAVYMITLYYDGNNTPGITLISGTNFCTFGVSGSNTITVTNSAGGNICYSWFINK